MGSLLIATGVLMYTWISGIHYSFLKQQVSLESPQRYPNDIAFKALIWPLLHVIAQQDTSIEPKIQD